jgi:putative ABC transport system permease protein
MPWHPGVFLKETAITLRSLRKERSFAALTVILLAFGIGLASAVFMLLWQAIYAQLPIPQPTQVFTFSSNVIHNGRSDSDAMAQTFSVPTYRYLADHFNASAGVIARHGELVNVEITGGPQHVLADFVSGNFFEVLGVRPMLGRSFGNRDDQDSTERAVAVLSYEFWQDAYGGDVSAWNTVLRVNGVPFRAVGVSPPGFRGLIAGQSPKVYLPMSAFADVNPGWHGDHDWSLRWVNAFVRLPANVSRAAAEAELQAIYRTAVREELASEVHPSEEYLRELSHEHLSLVPAAQGVHAMLDQWGEPLRILQWMTLALLSLAVINVAGLALVRGLRRRRELLIRCTVGATRPQVMRLHFQESLILALAGGLLGLWIARYGAELLVRLAHMDQRDVFSYGLHGWALGTHWAAVLVTGLVVGWFPAWQTAKLDLSAGLKEGALTHSATKSQALIRRTLSAAQVALSLVLVIAAGLFAKSLQNLVTVPVGFNPGHLTVFSVDAKLTDSTVQSSEVLWANIARRLKETPGVEDVTYGTGGPFPQGADMAVVIPSTNTTERSKYQSGMRSIIGPRYFHTLGIPVIAGREFDERDRTNMPDTVILNQTMARKLFGKSNPIGQTVTMFNGLDPNWLASVVGVVADHHQSWTRANAPLVYTPAQQARRITEITYYVRTFGPTIPETVIRAIVRQEAPSLAAYDVATMRSRMGAFASSNRAMAVLVGAFALFALVIAGVGIYGVVSYSASLRALEFGVRLSFGATQWDIARLVLKEALIILACGVMLGAPLTYVTLLIVRHQLVRVSLVEPGIYGTALLLLTMCSLVPAWIPAERAKRLSVIDALRRS